MCVFENNYYLNCIKENHVFNYDNFLEYVKEPKFQYGDVTYRQFNDKYSEEGWLGRKFYAIPAMLWAGFVKTIYHLALAILIQIPQRFNDKDFYLASHFFCIARDLQEAYGWLTTLFVNDRYGQFHIQESQFQKSCYVCFLEGNAKLWSKYDLATDESEEIALSGCNEKYVDHANDINKFIYDNYIVAYKGKGVDADDLSSANEFLLADNHASPGHTVLNTSFINIFAKQEDVVMVEAIPSMVEIMPDEELQSVWLKTKAKIVGWDTGKVGEILNSKKAQLSHDLELQCQILIRQLLDPTFAGNKEEVKKKLVKVVDKTIDAGLSLKEDSELITEAMINTFANRKQSMITSLDKAKEAYKKTFLIAGGLHLDVDDNVPLSLGSLKEFHKFLKTRKAVVLFPKNNAVVKMGAEKRNIIKQCQKEAVESLKAEYGQLLAEMNKLLEEPNKLHSF